MTTIQEISNVTKHDIRVSNAPEINLFVSLQIFTKTQRKKLQVICSIEPYANFRPYSLKQIEMKEDKVEAKLDEAEDEDRGIGGEQRK